MIRLLAALAATAIALLSASCGCCTSDPVAPELRPLPAFQPMPIIPEATK